MRHNLTCLAPTSRSKAPSTEAHTCYLPSRTDVMWNAWLYSGSDNLWAGLIMRMHEAVEERYGAPYARAREHAMLITVGVQALLAAALMMLAIFFGVDWLQDRSEDELLSPLDDFGSTMKNIGIILATASSIGLALSSVRQYLRTPISPSARIARDFASGAIKQQLGFMHKE